MKYSFEEHEIENADIVDRIMKTDLTPSIAPITQNINEIFKRISNAGVSNLFELRKALKDKPKITGFSKKTEIDEHYLVLLKREIEGWIPKKIKLAEFFWIDQTSIKALNSIQVVTTEDFFDIYQGDKKELEALNLKQTELDELFALSNISRIRWISPSVARILRKIGYDTIEKIAQADGKKLSKEFDECNQKNAYFKGKVGLRDILRVINEAGMQA